MNVSKEIRDYWDDASAAMQDAADYQNGKFPKFLEKSIEDFPLVEVSSIGELRWHKRIYLYTDKQGYFVCMNPKNEHVRHYSAVRQINPVNIEELKRNAYLGVM